MDIEIAPLKEPFSEDEMELDQPRSKTSLRMNYEAQVKVIQRQIGGLEQVRFKLGLSQRKMAQLLMVDPSAWTRWTKNPNPANNETAPPHIWRALQWYFIVQDKIPGLTPQYFHVENQKVFESKTFDRIEKSNQSIKDLEQKIEELKVDKQIQTEKLITDIEKLQKTIVQHRILMVFLFILFGAYLLLRTLLR